MSLTANAAAVVPRLPDGRVLVGLRTRAARSWPGTLAFPGGGVESVDEKLPLATGTELPTNARAARACALRELGEEVGLWLLCAPDGRRDEEAAAHAVAALRGGAALDEALAANGLVLDDRALVPLTLWPVPSGRFCVQQFLLPLEREPALVPPTTAELEDIRFESPASLRAGWRDGRVFLLSPIRRVVVGLAEEQSIERAVRALSLPPSASERARLDVVEGTCILAARTPTLPPATHTNAVLHDDILIDPATPYPEDQERFDRVLADALGGRRLAAIVCTHHHADHVGDVARLAARHRVPVYAHALTAERVPFKVDRLLDDGDEIAGLRALFTPGHAPGHLCLFEERTRMLVAGDMVAAVGSILIDPSEGHMGTYLASLERLIALAPRGVIPAHGPLIADGTARLAEQREHRRLRQEAILAQLPDSGDGASIEEIVQAVYGRDTPAAMLPFAQRSVLAALVLCVERQQAIARGDRWLRLAAA